MYWESCGAENTNKTIGLAMRRAEELGVSDLVIASNSGQTVLLILDYLAKNSHSNINPNLVCVTHQVGFRNPGEDEMESTIREQLLKKKVKILTTTHLFAGVDRALRYQFSGLYPAEIVAMSLRMLGQGVKVAVEISLMALDSGLIKYGHEVIAIGGTGSGADTALVIKPEHSAEIFKTQIKEIICKPRL